MTASEAVPKMIRMPMTRTPSSGEIPFRGRTYGEIARRERGPEAEPSDDLTLAIFSALWSKIFESRLKVIRIT